MKTIVVAFYDAYDPNRSLSFFFSAGPTIYKKNKPELCAPGHGVMAANSTTQLSVRKSGTSMAAPHVTGLVALLMQVGGKGLTIDQISETLQSTAVKVTEDELVHRYGSSKANALKALLYFTKENLPSAETTALSSEIALNGYKHNFQYLLQSMAVLAKESKAKIKVNTEFE